MRVIKSIFVGVIIVLFGGCSDDQAQDVSVSSVEKEVEMPFNIIFLVGDGMGLSQLSTAYFYGEAEPNFSRFPIVGLSKTRSGSHKITDSAAGATAFSCGEKTYNGAIGVALDSSSKPTIVEDLSVLGWNTGLVSTSSITHATPASFYAHVENRGMQEEIAKQLVYSDVDFFAGGGHRWFLDRLDSLNYWDSLIDQGFVLDTSSLYTEWTGGDLKPAYLMAPDGMTPKYQGRDEFLPDATQKAIDHLSAKGESFFLMVEGSQIDWGGHSNNGEYLIQEVLDFDQAIGKALDFAEKQGNTLVVVTADHECGGFAMVSERKEGPYKRVYNDYNSLVSKFATDGHSSTMVPVLSFGAGSNLFNGIYENTEIYQNFLEVTGLKE